MTTSSRELRLLNAISQFSEDERKNLQIFIDQGTGNFIGFGIVKDNKYEPFKGTPEQMAAISILEEEYKIAESMARLIARTKISNDLNNMLDLPEGTLN